MRGMIFLKPAPALPPALNGFATLSIGASGVLTNVSGGPMVGVASIQVSATGVLVDEGGADTTAPPRPFVFRATPSGSNIVLEVSQVGDLYTNVAPSGIASLKVEVDGGAPVTVTSGVTSNENEALTFASIGTVTDTSESQADDAWTISAASLVGVDEDADNIRFGYVELTGSWRASVRVNSVSGPGISEFATAHLHARASTDPGAKMISFGYWASAISAAINGRYRDADDAPSDGLGYQAGDDDFHELELEWNETTSTFTCSYKDGSGGRHVHATQAIDMPSTQLVGFAIASLAAGSPVTVEIEDLNFAPRSLLQYLYVAPDDEDHEFRVWYVDDQGNVGESTETLTQSTAGIPWEPGIRALWYGSAHTGNVASSITSIKATMDTALGGSGNEDIKGLMIFVTWGVLQQSYANLGQASFQDGIDFLDELLDYRDANYPDTSLDFTIIDRTFGSAFDLAHVEETYPTHIYSDSDYGSGEFCGVAGYEGGFDGLPRYWAAPVSGKSVRGEMAACIHFYRQYYKTRKVGVIGLEGESAIGSEEMDTDPGFSYEEYVEGTCWGLLQDIEALAEGDERTFVVCNPNYSGLPATDRDNLAQIAANSGAGFGVSCPDILSPAHDGDGLTWMQRALTAQGEVGGEEFGDIDYRGEIFYGPKMEDPFIAAGMDLNEAIPRAFDMGAQYLWVTHYPSGSEPHGNAAWSIVQDYATDEAATIEAIPVPATWT